MLLKLRLLLKIRNNFLFFDLKKRIDFYFLYLTIDPKIRELLKHVATVSLIKEIERVV